MNDPIDTVSVWTTMTYGGPLNLSEYQQKSRQILTALQRSNPMFDHLVTIGRQRLAVVPDGLVGLEDLIRDQVLDEDHPEDYLDRLSNGSLGPKSLCRVGFSLSYCSLAADNQSILPLEKGGVDMRLRGGSAETESSTVLELPMDSKSTLHAPQVLRRLLDLFVQTWGCTVGGVSVYRYEQIIRAGNPASYAGQWLFFLPFPNLAKCLPSDIRHEPFANGILIETTPHAPDANNPADIAAGKRVRDVLDGFGLVNDATYAIEGWPPDREEALYEQFISGAPSDRKYAVHCVNFDGYDPDRKVLLYATLFRPLRRHPKEWGLRGWDGPVLNEAKRQVRAAAKAGGVPIEWHIGLEEPAHQVRQLLADHTSITEQQLRVIYTPLDEALRSPPP